MNNQRRSGLLNGMSITRAGRAKNIIRNNILVVIIIVLFVFGSIIFDNFLNLYNIQNILINIAIIGVLAIGQTAVMLMGEIDLSVGSLMAFGPIAAISITQFIGSFRDIMVIQGGNYVTSGLFLITVLTIAVSSIIGLISGFIVVKGNIPSLIVTLGMLYALRGFAYIISGGHPLYFTRLIGFKWLGTSKFLNIPVSFLVYLAIGIISILVLRYTKIGPKFYATGGNEKAAIYSGINTDLYKIMAFTFSGFCAGISALIYSSRLEAVEAAQATGYELTAIAIVVIGGTTIEGGRGKISGTILGGIVLGLILNIITLIGLVVWYQTIIMGIIIIFAVFAYLRRAGLNN